MDDELTGSNRPIFKIPLTRLTVEQTKKLLCCVGRSNLTKHPAFSVLFGLTGGFTGCVSVLADVAPVGDNLSAVVGQFSEKLLEYFPYTKYDVTDIMKMFSIGLYFKASEETYAKYQMMGLAANNWILPVFLKKILKTDSLYSKQTVYCRLPREL